MQRHIECDVAVVGGGAAGVAAAIGASRTGAKTVLIERNPYFGGQATNSQVTAYCGFFTRGENYDQVVEGIGGEVLRRLETYGTNIHPRPSKSTGNVSVSFNPEYVKLVMDQMLLESNVEYFLHAQMYEVVNNNGNLVDEKEDSLVGIKRFGQLFPTYFLYRVVVALAGIVVGVIGMLLMYTMITDAQFSTKNSGGVTFFVLESYQFPDMGEAHAA